MPEDSARPTERPGASNATILSSPGSHRLQGRWLKLFNLAWAIAMLVALVSATMGVDASLKRAQWPGWSSLGIFVTAHDDRFFVRELLSAEARQSGLRPGMAIVAINGTPVSTDISQRRLNRSIWSIPHPEVRLSAGPPGTPPGTFVLTRHPANAELPYRRWLSSWGWSVELLLVGIPPVLLMLVAALVLRKSGRKALLPGLLSLSLLLVAGSNFVSQTFWIDSGWPLVARVLDNAGWSGIFLSLLLPAKGPLRPNWLWVLPLCLLPFWALDLRGDGLGVWKIPLHSLTFGVGTLIVALRYRGSFRQARLRARWLLVGFMVGTLAIAGAHVFQMASEISGLADYVRVLGIVYPVQSFGVCAYAVGLLVAVQKYGLYDADSVLTRTLAYSALLLLAAILYAISSTLIHPALDRYFAGADPLLPKLAGPILIAALVAPLRTRFEAWADDRFRRQLKDLKERLPADIAEFRQFASRDELFEEVLGRIERNTGAEHAAILVGEVPVALRQLRADQVERWTQDRLAATGGPTSFDPSDATFPIRVPLRVLSGPESPPLGWLLVGPRADGSMFGIDERNAVEALSRPLARALRVIERREATGAQLAALTGAVAALAKGRPAG